MKIIDGIAYATTECDFLEVVDIKVLDDMMIILTFNNGEDRLFDASSIITMPAFARLKDDMIFKSAKISDGIVTWCDGEIDIAPETMYKDSFKYERMKIS